MKFVRIVGLVLIAVVAPLMIASAPADIEQAYKAEKAKVAKPIDEKKAEKERVAQEKKAKAQEEKQKKAAAAKEKQTKFKKAKASFVDRTAKTTKKIQTPKAAPQPKVKAVKKTTPEPVAKKPAEVVPHRATNLRTLDRITVVKGETFMIKRPASPNFGRTWKFHKPLPIQIEMIGEAKFVPAHHPGRNEGFMEYTFKAIKPGLVLVEFEKIYPPELRDKKPLKVRIVPVEIKE